MAATRTKKKAEKQSNDTITFKKSELLKKLKTFLEEEGACEGDWANKVRVQFLGETIKNIKVRLQYETEIEMEMPADGLPSHEDVAQQIRMDLDDGVADIEIEYSDFKVLDVKAV